MHIAFKGFFAIFSQTSLLGVISNGLYFKIDIGLSFVILNNSFTQIIVCKT